MAKKDAPRSQLKPKAEPHAAASLAERWAAQHDGVAVDCADANTATALLRTVLADGPPVIAFDHVWESHPTWQIALQEGTAYEVDIAPPEDAPGGPALLRRRKP